MFLRGTALSSSRRSGDAFLHASALAGIGVDALHPGETLKLCAWLWGSGVRR